MPFPATTLPTMLGGSCTQETLNQLVYTPGVGLLVNPRPSARRIDRTWSHARYPGECPWRACAPGRFLRARLPSKALCKT